MTTEQVPSKERDFLNEFDAQARSMRALLTEAGRLVNYHRTLLRDLRPHLPKDHPWLPGIDEQIAEQRPFTPEEAKAYRSFIEEHFGPAHEPLCDCFGAGLEPGCRGADEATKAGHRCQLRAAQPPSASPWKTFAQEIPKQGKYIWWSPDGYKAALSRAADFCEKDKGVWCYAVEPPGRPDPTKSGEQS